MLKGHVAIPATLFALTAALVSLSPASTSREATLDACPMEIGPLTGTDLPIQEFVLEELEPSAMLSRAYAGRHPLERVWLIVSYFENARYGAHDPEVCYRSQGWQTEPLSGVTLTAGSGVAEANRFRVVRRTEDRLVLYWWYIDEETVTRDHRSFMNAMALQGILKGSNHGSFIRVSTPVWPSEAEAEARLTGFATQVLAALPQMFQEGTEESD